MWKHRLSNKNLEDKTALCSKCGITSIKVSGSTVRCWNAIKEYRKTVGHNRPYHQPNPGICEICGNNNRVSYDHDHKTNKFRGWLCINCNTALGLVHDNPSHLQKLIDYLQK